MTYDRKNQQVFYQGKDQTYDYHPLDFLAYVSLHIPDKGEQLLRYYGWYSNKSRGLRKKDRCQPFPIPPVEEDLTHYQKQCRSAWARLIREIYEVEPLVCPRCKHPMRDIACIERSENIAFIANDSAIYASCLNMLHIPPHTSQAKLLLTAKFHPATVTWKNTLLYGEGKVSLLLQSMRSVKEEILCR